MELSATGEPAVVQEDTHVHVGLDLRPGSLTLIRDGEDFEPYRAVVQFVGVHDNPWAAQEVKFSATGPDGKNVGLTVDLLNDSWDGPRDDVPEAIWKVVALAATSAGDIGITYTAPGPT
ncbi:hypothetical protein EJC51_47200 [Streptomyces aquilus]|uniref:Uncharacterized protein n=1 Tax=Streptomyces aquilus TaxID=2548456 RepID=A0A3Q9C9B6_9ACTN|nr:hypothetical protein [Streptomyces aquilus]AZP14754.1 hypothetical protein EJC51_00345 [Streptomyces aquilus]AZP22950.1 hypothetical protein EJC51_47200 [Streptomyces aquilus]